MSANIPYISFHFIGKDFSRDAFGTRREDSFYLWKDSRDAEGRKVEMNERKNKLTLRIDE